MQYDIASIIICSYNGEGTLQMCLNSLLLAQDVKFIELILVNSNSSDSTLKIMENFKVNNEPSFHQVKIINAKISGHSIALNHAMRMALGKLLVFTDDDCTIDQYWIKSYLTAANSYQTVSYFVGRIITVSSKKFPIWWKLAPKSMSGREFNSSKNIFHKYSKEAYLIGCNMAIRKEFIERYRLSFDERLGPSPNNSTWLGADIKLGHQIISHGGLGCFVKEAIVYHHIKERRICWKYIINHSFASGRSSLYYKEKVSMSKLSLLIVTQFIKSIFSLLTFNDFNSRKSLIILIKKLGLLYQQLHEFENKLKNRFKKVMRDVSL